MLKHACGEQRMTTIQDVKSSAGVVPEINIREYTSCMLIPSVNKAADSSEEMLVVPSKNMSTQNLFFKKKSDEDGVRGVNR